MDAHSMFLKELTQSDGPAQGSYGTAAYLGKTVLPEDTGTAQKMASRAEQVGGSRRIVSTPGQGTRIMRDLPQKASS